MKALFVLVFVLLVALCTLLSPVIYRGYMEDDLTAKVSKLVEDEGLAGVDIQFKGHELDLSASSIASPEQIQRIGNIADDVWGAYVPDAKASAANLPANFSGREDANGLLVLGGKLPSDGMRSSVVSSAKAKSGAEVRDEMVVDRVGSPAWGTGIGGLFGDVAARAEEGRVAVEGNRLVVGGVVESEEIEGELLAAAKELPGVGEVVDELEVAEWQDGFAKVVRSGDQITVTGMLPDQSTKAGLLASVKASAGGVAVEDQTTIGERVRPVWWTQHSGGYLPKFFSGATGDAWVSYTEPELTYSGTAPDAAGKASLEALAGTLPDGRSASGEINFAAADTPSPEPAPVRKLDSDLKELAIYFNSGSSWIKKEEQPKIVKAAATITSSGSGDLGLIVGGYADLTGNAASNEKLSLERANAVRDKLIELGVPASRLTVRHFGEDTSKVDPSEHWKSRRVQVSVTSGGN